MPHCAKTNVGLWHWVSPSARQSLLLTLIFKLPYPARLTFFALPHPSRTPRSPGFCCRVVLRRGLRTCCALPTRGTSCFMMPLSPPALSRFCFPRVILAAGCCCSRSPARTPPLGIWPPQRYPACACCPLGFMGRCFSCHCLRNRPFATRLHDLLK